MGHAEERQGGARVWPRRAAPDRPPVRMEVLGAPGTSVLLPETQPSSNTRPPAQQLRLLLTLRLLTISQPIRVPPRLPRSYTCQANFAKTHMPDYPLYKLTAMLYQVVPDILKSTGKGERWKPGCTRVGECVAGGQAAAAGLERKVPCVLCTAPFLLHRPLHLTASCYPPPSSPACSGQPVAQRGCPQRRAAAVLWHHRGVSGAAAGSRRRLLMPAYKAPRSLSSNVACTSRCRPLSPLFTHFSTSSLHSSAPQELLHRAVWRVPLPGGAGAGRQGGEGGKRHRQTHKHTLTPTCTGAGGVEPRPGPAH